MEKVGRWKIRRRRRRRSIGGYIFLFTWVAGASCLTSVDLVQLLFTISLIFFLKICYVAIVTFVS